MSLPPPATEAGIYLAAVLGELRALRAAVEGGGRDASSPVEKPDTGRVELTEPDAPTPQKRTRTRVRG